ncbi:MAG: hypothetical protein ACOXZH_00885 [Bacteroidales bacterium]|jgi:hypothetical protein
MNYLDIVLQGYFNDNNREFLERYFFREFKKAEKEQFFEAVEFFNGCLKVIEGWEKHLQDKVFERKRELYLMLNEAKNGTLSYAELEGKTIEEKRQETIQYCEQELKDVRPDGIGSLSFTVHLHSLTNGRIAYNMPYYELLVIKIAILKAFKKTQPNIEPLPPQPIDEQKPIKYGAKEYALTYIFDLYAIGQQVPINRIEGSFDAKKIKQDASKFPMYDKAPDTFYRAVKSVLEYDLNKPIDLQNISKDWLNAVRNLSTNWVITEQYLKDKNLIGE